MYVPFYTWQNDPVTYWKSSNTYPIYQWKVGKQKNFTHERWLV